MARRRIAFIGAGNVATHLAKAFSTAGAEITTVCSRDMAHAGELAAAVGARPATSVDDIPADVDFIIIATTDSAISDIASQLPSCTTALVAHTSGSVDLQTLARKFSRCGVLYPLQTFSKHSYVDMSRVPFFIEGNNADTLAELDNLASSISGTTYHADSELRATLHIAGVLSCNFVNYLWDCTSQVLARRGLPFEVVRPLVELTMNKAFEQAGPHAAQTGPAMRGDTVTIAKHLAALDYDPQLQQVYNLLTQSIMNSHKTASHHE